jgi:hypothetical protein
MEREALAERMLRDQVIMDDASGHQVFLNNPF